MQLETVTNEELHREEIRYEGIYSEETMVRIVLAKVRPPHGGIKRTFPETGIFLLRIIN